MSFMQKAVIATLFCIPTIVMAQIFEHEGQTPLLVELYTSEGCSSCPPADDYISALKNDERLWKSIVPMAFHVDYWDYIGWKDELAQAAFSDRQRAHKQSGATSGVYTPGWLVDGLEWRAYFRRAPFPDAPDRIGGKLTSQLNDNGVVSVAYQTNTSPSNNYQFNVALLGFDITNTVDAGENRGETLTHQFVVLEHHQDATRDGALFVLEKLNPSKRQALVVWVTPEGRYEPEQVVSGWVDL